MRNLVCALALCCAAVLGVAFGVFAGSHEGEFTWYTVTGPGKHEVDVVTGHGKTCYVFEQYGNSVLLWCEPHN